MNVLFVTYGHLGTNSAVPLAVHARELAALGHACAVALPARCGEPDDPVTFEGCVAGYEQALRSPESLFPDGRPADVVHAWTPRENVRRFTTAWLARHPAPLVVYLEDNERCIAMDALGTDGIEALLRAGDEDLADLMPECLPHPFRFEAFVGLADAAIVIQDKLAADVPPWVPCTTVMPGVDLALFAPQPASPALRARHGLADGERVIVYPGGLAAHTRGPLRSLCEAVGLLNREGQPCRLLRTGPIPLDFLHEMPREVRDAVLDLGVIPRARLPELLALADVLVQPGRRDAFEDLRLPGKLPEFLAMGKPVVLPDANVANLLADGRNALVMRPGSAQEIARRCTQVFADAALAARLGAGARRFAEATFDPRVQARRLLAVYERARHAFRPEAAQRVWAGATPDTPPVLLLARRLRELPPSDHGPLPRLRVYQELLLLAQARLADGSADPALLRGVLRSRALELGELQPLAAGYAHALELLEQRLVAVTAPRPGAVRQAGRALRHAGSVMHRLHALMRQKGGPAGLLSVAWRIVRTEGWPGVRRRLAALSAAARIAGRRRGDAAAAAAVAQRGEGSP